ncbi:hypothetical protein [Vineibacter terrae]|uniref:hypothetical protein n=1 Tax=Vineibacter terrae TaxID=2586908 RepID=UPI002E30DF5C|nr:hypothetical protein [Vineibacter terrae]HEX2887387.1 hypothetical protein [Vineibacter terrae]
MSASRSFPRRVDDQAIRYFDRAGVRAVRFNFYRGVITDLEATVRLARRVFDVAGWHVEIYLDGYALRALTPTLVTCRGSWSTISA